MMITNPEAQQRVEAAITNTLDRVIPGWRERTGGVSATMLSITAQAALDEVTFDGDHTMTELYRFRMVYHAQAVRQWVTDGIPVVKSWRHHDGQRCFGGGWYIVVAQLPTGQVSNHYRTGWQLFDVPEVDRAPVWDGHTATDVLERIEQYLEQTAT